MNVSRTSVENARLNIHNPTRLVIAIATANP
jgi:hypothetical protein